MSSPPNSSTTKAPLNLEPGSPTLGSSRLGSPGEGDPVLAVGSDPLPEKLGAASGLAGRPRMRVGWSAPLAARSRR